MTIGENIRKIRKSKGLTLKQLAEKSGYAYQHIHHIEVSNHIPKVSTAIDIADVLEVSLDELVGRDFKKVLKPVEKFPFDVCPACGGVVSPRKKYCCECGTKLDWSDRDAE